MIALGLLTLLVLVLVIAVYSTTRSHDGTTDTTRTTTTGEVHIASVQRWVTAGLLDEEQARAIERFEADRRASIPVPRVSPAIEALAYVGGALLTSGIGMLVSRFWDDIGATGHLVLVAIAALGTGFVGGIVGEAEPVATRLRGFMWAVSAGSAGAFVGLFIFSSFDRTGEPVAFSTALTAAIVSGIYWSRRDRPMQHVVTFVALVVAIGVGIAWVAPILGLATAAVWTAVGIGVNEVLALAPGVLGIFVFLPWTLGRFFGESLGAPVIVMLSGIVLLLAVAVLWRRRARGAHIGDLWGGHFTGIDPG